MNWIKERGVKPPDGFAEDFMKRWRERYLDTGEEDRWLRANGLTRDEFEGEVTDRAKIAWLLAADPGSFGLAFNDRSAYIEIVSETRAGQDEAVDMMMENAYICDWAKKSGIECPEKVLDDHVETWRKRSGIDDLESWLAERGVPDAGFREVMAEKAFADWVVDRGLLYFGEGMWTPDIGLLRDLQVTGRVQSLVEELAGGGGS